MSPCPDLRAWEPRNNLSTSAVPGLCQLQGEVSYQVPEPMDAHPTGCVSQAPPAAVNEAMRNLKGTPSPSATLQRAIG